MIGADVFAAVDVGGTKIGIEIFAGDSTEPLETHRFDTPRSGDLVEEMAREIAEAAQGKAVSAVGIGCPGPLDPLEGVILNPPNLSRSWWGLALPDELGARLGCPAALENDCNLGALGEDLYGGGKGYGSTLYVTISTGVGGGLIVDGRIFGGWRGFAVEIGHTRITDKPYKCGCGRYGCVEAATSGTAIATRAREAGWAPPEGVPLSARAVADSARNGDETAFEVLRETTRHLAAAMINFIYSYDPAVVLLGGGVAQSDLYMQLVEQAVAEEPMMPAFRGTPIHRAALGNRSVVYGALALARRTLERA